jgi:hypothetical protein
MSIIKRFLIGSVFICSVVSYGRTAAQVFDKGSSQVFIGYGIPNYPKLLLTPNFLFLASPTHSYGIGPVMASYQYAISRRVTVGLMGRYTFATTSFVFTSFDSVNQQQTSRGASARLGITEAGAMASYHYLNSRKYDLYSGLTAGFAYVDGKATEDLGLGLDDYNISSTAFSYSVNTGIRMMLTPSTGIFVEAIFQQIILDGIFLDGILMNGGVSFKWGGKPVKPAHK